VPHARARWVGALRPAIERRFVVGADGRGSTTLVVRTGPVGRDRVGCGRNERCAVAVLTEHRGTAGRVVPVEFAELQGAGYDPPRVALGLGVAALLLALAFALYRGTDWTPAHEATAPEIDDAEYADLDAIVAALPPEPDDPFDTATATRR
jgi:hypothetical protein